MFKRDDEPPAGGRPRKAGLEAILAVVAGREAQ